MQVEFSSKITGHEANWTIISCYTGSIYCYHSPRCLAIIICWQIWSDWDTCHCNLHLVCFYLIAFNQITDKQLNVSLVKFNIEPCLHIFFWQTSICNYKISFKSFRNESVFDCLIVVEFSQTDDVPARNDSEKKNVWFAKRSRIFYDFFFKRSGSKHQFDVNSFRQKRNFSREKLSLGCKLNNIVRPFSFQSQALPAENRNKIVSSFDYSLRGNKKLALKLVTISAIIFTVSVCSG